MLFHLETGRISTPPPHVGVLFSHPLPAFPLCWKQRQLGPIRSILEILDLEPPVRGVQQEDRARMWGAAEENQRERAEGSLKPS